mmetsp:Transcript_26097/g.30124  ORF Transcript_26097/g.30124 Transcript_26097/m.30124 type:complete len:107 (+) Transcript_26097:20-340(+)
MSIRPRRKAAQIKTFNEELMFMEQCYLEEPEPAPSMQLNNKFVKPKTRVPIQQPTPKIVQAVARTEAFSNRPSLRSFLNNPVGSKRMKTSIWGTPKAKIYDSNSYI